MDISNTDINHIAFFSFGYEITKNIFDVEPVDASDKNVEEKV